MNAAIDSLPLQADALSRARAFAEPLLANESLDSGEPAGMCGLLRREGLEDADIGYALLPEHWGAGYAREACALTLALGRERFGLDRVVAIVSPGNARSVRVLEHLGFADEGIIRLKDDGEPLQFFGMGLG